MTGAPPPLPPPPPVTSRGCRRRRRPEHSCAVASSSPRGSIKNNVFGFVLFVILNYKTTTKVHVIKKEKSSLISIPTLVRILEVLMTCSTSSPPRAISGLEAWLTGAGWDALSEGRRDESELEKTCGTESSSPFSSGSSILVPAISS